MTFKKISQHLFISILTLPLLLSNTFAEEKLTEAEKAKITSEINTLFDKSIKAGENLDIKGITESVDDTLQAGFIDNGLYYNSFEDVMNIFRNRINGLDSQKIMVENKKITILSSQIVLLTASGNAEAKLRDGRTVKGKFAWSFVYSKINNEWKVVHSHMSNPA